MAKYGLGHRFHDLKYFEVGILFVFLKFMIYSRTPLQQFVKRDQFNVNLSCFKQVVNN